MRAVIQRVSEGAVCVDGEQLGAIGKGYVVLLGVEQGDTDQDLRYICDKIAGLRVFTDEEDKMNLSIQDVHGEILMISQFTLCADARHGRRPSFTEAARPEIANVFYEKAIDDLRGRGISVESGRFQADMKVSLVNDGPVTILLDSRKRF